MLKKNKQQKKVLTRDFKQKSNESNGSITVFTEQKNQISMPPVKTIQNNPHSTTNSNVIEQCSEQRRQALNRRLRTNRMLMAMVGVFLWFVH